MKKIYLIAAVIALAAGLATYLFANELKTSKIVTGVDEATVLVAIEDINENTILTKEMFQAVKLPVTAVSKGTISNAEDIVGYMTTVEILAGEQLMARKIIRLEDNETGGKLSYSLEEGKYAYSVCIGIENAISYFLKENDKVNIYDIINVSTEPLLENVRVIKISDYTANVQEEAGTEIMSYIVMTLELDKEQIVKMMSVDDPGNGERFRAVLVSHVEAYGLADAIAAAGVPENQSPEPQTNIGMGELTTAPPESEAQ